MLGKLLKKNVVMPGGPGASPAVTEGLPPPIIGKRFPTYVWTDVIVGYPVSLGMMFLLPVVCFAIFNVAMPLPVDFDDSQYTIQYDTARALRVTTLEKENWDAIRLASRMKEGQTSQACVVQALRGLGTTNHVAEYLQNKATSYQRKRVYIIYRPTALRQPQHSAFLPPQRRYQVFAGAV